MQHTIPEIECALFTVLLGWRISLWKWWCALYSMVPSVTVFYQV